MTTKEDLEKELKKEEYNFLKTNKNLGENIIMLCAGGSRAYGLEHEGSDWDIRGIALNSKKNILLGHDFEQVVDNGTDTTIYSFNKIIRLLCACNPNTIELLGLDESKYKANADFWKPIFDNKMLFLSQEAFYSFGGYANAQLRRLEHKILKTCDKSEKDNFLLETIQNVKYDFKKRYAKCPDDSIRLYIEESQNKQNDSDILVDISLSGYLLKDLKGILSEITNIVNDYDKLGKRNKQAIEHNKLCKHMTHLIRLYFMCFDILEKKEIITYRAKEHDLLMSIHNGDYLDNKGSPIPEFYEMVSNLYSRLKYDKENTDLPEKVDTDLINDLVVDINSKIFES